uniref:Uncharacterized protein n=1 Tax=Glossina brevipalpis TaxID=37001 RepID=A0A1A9W096_9MUSC
MYSYYLRRTRYKRVYFIVISTCSSSSSEAQKYINKLRPTTYIDEKSVVRKRLRLETSRRRVPLMVLCLINYMHVLASHCASMIHGMNNFRFNNIVENELYPSLVSVVFIMYNCEIKGQHLSGNM